MKKALFITTILAGGIGAYIQYRKLLKSKITFNGLLFGKVNRDQIQFDLYLNLHNATDIPIKLISQSYTLFINGTPITRASNSKAIRIKAGKTNVVPLYVKIPTQKVKNVLKTSLVDMLLTPEKFTLEVDIKSRVKFLGFTLDIPFLFRTNLKDLINKNQSQ